MNFYKQIEQLQTLNRLIKQECTGTPTELAERLHISRSKLYEMIDALKCWGLNIEYDRSRKTFYFLQEAELDIQFSLKVIQADEIKKLYGGSYIFPSVLFSGRSKPTLDITINRLL